MKLQSVHVLLGFLLNNTINKSRGTFQRFPDMTKRRVESSSPHEAPLQKKRRSVCDAEHELAAGNALHAPDAAAPPALFTTLIGERRRKRPRGCEDYEQHGRTEAQTDGVNTETEGVRVSGKFRRAGGACTYEKASKECASGTKQEERTKVPTFTQRFRNKNKLC